MLGYTVTCFLGLSYALLCTNAQSTGFTPKEKEAIQKLRDAVGKVEPDYLNEDFMLINFLRDKNMDVKEAATKLKEAVKWRKDNNIAGIHKEKLLPELFQYRIEGIDKKGNPVIYIAPARWDIRKLIVAGQRDQLVRYWAQFVDRGMQEILKIRKSTGKDIRKSTLILDLHGYNLRQHGCLQCFQTYFDWVRIYEHNYPQNLEAFYMINAPRIFTPLLELLRGVFSQHTQKVLKVFDPDKEKWKKELLKVIDEDELIQFYGGKRPSSA